MTTAKQPKYQSPLFFTAARTAAVATGAAAVGVLAIGALAIGALAIGRLRISKARFDKVEINELTVRHLRVIQSGKRLPISRAEQIDTLPRRAAYAMNPAAKRSRLSLRQTT